MFPRDDSIKEKCQESKGKPFSDYCAIRLTECFLLAGVPMHRFKGAKCWGHSGNKHALRAEDMAKFLTDSPPTGLGAKESIDPLKFQSLLAGRKGIVFFKDYWQRGSGKSKEKFENRSGDHIDLWNDGEITSSGMTMRSVYEFFGMVSDLNQARKAWFWEIK
jgi:hypothetical protein